ncbi:MAG: hypothetical protein ABSF50_13480 [Burkholderiaceae bacterium]
MDVNRPLDPNRPNAEVPLGGPFYGAPPTKVRPDRVADLIVYLPVVITTLFAKFTLPAFSALGLGFGLPLTLGVLALGILSGRVIVDLKRAAFFMFMVSWIGLVQVAREQDFSLSSLIFMIVTSFVYVLGVPRPGKGIDDAMRFFVNFVTVIALCGIVQFAMQFVSKTAAFPIDNLVPQGFIIRGFNNLNPLYYGSTIFKSNGVFLKEPSFFSQIIAMAIVVELATLKRFSRLGILALAAILSYSGTGLLVLAVCFPVLLIRNHRLDVLGLIVGVILIASLFAVPLRLDLILSRIYEFNDPSSSAFQRFVSWIYLLRDTTFSSPGLALFGYGPGNFHDVEVVAPFNVSELFHSKVIIEFGLLGGLLYTGFLMYCIFTSEAPFVVRLAVVVLHFMNGAYADSVLGMALTLVLLTPRHETVRARRIPPVRRPDPKGSLVSRNATGRPVPN